MLFNTNYCYIPQSSISQLITSKLPSNTGVEPELQIQPNKENETVYSKTNNGLDKLFYRILKGLALRIHCANLLLKVKKRKKKCCRL